MTHIRCLVGFGSLNDPELMGTSGAVLKGLPGNKVFSNPPPELAQLQTAADDMTGAMAAQVHGGRAATAEKKKKSLQGFSRRHGQASYACINKDGETAP